MVKDIVVAVVKGVVSGVLIKGISVGIEKIKEFCRKKFVKKGV